MPKHGWKWRTEQLRSRSHEELEWLLRETSVYQVSGKLARWIAENVWENVYALNRIVADDRARWARPYLLRLLDQSKDGPFGDWIVIVLTGSNRVLDPKDADRLIDLYHDETAHPDTRGSAVFGLSQHVSVANPNWNFPSLSVETRARIRQVCAYALKDPNPYARAGACWLARQLGEFREEVQALRNDRTRIWQTGGTVGSYAESWFE